MIDFLVKSEQPKYGITEEIRKLLLGVSAAEADVLLAPARKALEIRGVGTTRSVHTPLRTQIPVKTHFDRDTLTPGCFACDTVTHCGPPYAGSFAKH
jgi:hypothetical protein